MEESVMPILESRGLEPARAAGDRQRPPDGKPLNQGVEWVGGGASTTRLAGLKAGNFDAVVAVTRVDVGGRGSGIRSHHL